MEADLLVGDSKPALRLFQQLRTHEWLWNSKQGDIVKINPVINVHAFPSASRTHVSTMDLERISST